VHLARETACSLEPWNRSGEKLLKQRGLRRTREGGTKIYACEESKGFKRCWQQYHVVVAIPVHHHAGSEAQFGLQRAIHHMPPEVLVAVPLPSDSLILPQSGNGTSGYVGQITAIHS